MIKVLFVCLGNICRSPMAEFICKQMVKERGLTDNFIIDSAATEGFNEIYHIGIHHGAKEILKTKKVPFNEHYSRQIRKKDYQYYDYILAMDNNNIQDIVAITGPDTKNKVHLLLEYTGQPRNIKDPWYTHNFDEAYEDILVGCQSFLDSLELPN